MVNLSIFDTDPNGRCIQISARMFIKDGKRPSNLAPSMSDRSKYNFNRPQSVICSKPDSKILAPVFDEVSNLVGKDSWTTRSSRQEVLQMQSTKA